MMQTIPAVEEQVARCIEGHNSVVTETHDDTRDQFLRGACVSIGGWTVTLKAGLHNLLRALTLDC